MRRLLFFLLGALLPCFVSPVQGSEALALERRLASVFRDNNTKVVRIKAAYENGGENGQVSLRVGTGFFVSSDGLILANSSVTDGARRIWIEQGDSSFVAEMVGADAETNIALLKVTDQPKGSFEFIPVDEQAFPEIGTLLLSIGCALEFDPAPRLGLVSGRDSNFGERFFPTSYIRTTIPANPGEGGSPVLDLNGRLLGMIVASLPEVGASYVIPASAIGKVRDDLLLDGKVQYGWIGFEVESQMRGPDDSAGLIVTGLTPGGPAEAAGVEEGDRIIFINGETVPSINAMRHRFFLARVGQYLEFQLERGDEVVDLGIKVAARPSIAE
tara:strand:- start:36824 stop:37810 length:987 start_codon:yes stop_codon:yes gene_type:complete